MEQTIADYAPERFVKEERVEEILITHDAAEDAHTDIRQKIGTDISTHNAAADAHSGIREAATISYRYLPGASGVYSNAYCHKNAFKEVSVYGS